MNTETNIQKSRRDSVPKSPQDKFTSLCLFYRTKNKEPDSGLFSCLAGEMFPDSWHAAFESGVWEEKGVYGDNFRKYFGL